MTELTGEQFKVVIGNKIDKNNGYAIYIHSEDDGVWHEHGSWFSSHWLDDLIKVLKLAKMSIEKGVNVDVENRARF